MGNDATAAASPTPRVAVGVPIGNVYDKYGSSNPIEQMLVAGFFAAVDRCLPPRAPGRVLEAGTGEGEVSTRIRRRWPQTNVMGIDLPDVKLSTAWHRVGLVGAFADIADLPFPDRGFDLVIAAEVLEHVPDPDRALRELRRVARDRLVLTVPNEPLWRAANLARGKYLGRWGNTPGHIQHWSRRAFCQLVSRHLEIERVCSPFPWTVVAARRR